MSRIQRPLLAIADRLDPFFLDAQIDKVFGCFIGTLLAECQVVFHGAPFVAVSFDNEFVCFIFQIGLGARLQDRLCFRFKIVFVEIEMDIRDLEFLQNRRLLLYCLSFCSFGRFPGCLLPGCLISGRLISERFFAKFLLTKRPLPGLFVVCYGLCGACTIGFCSWTTIGSSLKAAFFAQPARNATESNKTIGTSPIQSSFSLLLIFPPPWRVIIKKYAAILFMAHDSVLLTGR